MKKTKKVISYIMLLVPFSLPAACSPINPGSNSNTYGSNNFDHQAELDDTEQLRLIVERYFEQQEQQQGQRAAHSQRTTTEDLRDDGADTVTVESERDLQEELEGLKETGEWVAVEPEKGTQCDLSSAPVEEPVWPEKRVRPVIEEPEVADLNKIVPERHSSATVKQISCGFPVQVNKQVEYYLNLFQGKQRKNFRRWLERSGKYLPFITQELKKAGLPVELAWLSMIESGFNPSAYSRSHASGLWQFIPGTGRNYGLRIDSWADERRDPEKATKAAISYLKALYKRFGDWHLAVAAYNAGEGTIEQGLRRYNANNFWELAQRDYLSLETKRYVPQMIAAVLISRNPDQYGFSNIRYRKPIEHEVIRVPAGTPLKAVAASASIKLSQLKELNNDLLKNRVPTAKGGWSLKVPAGRAALVAANLPNTLQHSTASYGSHRVAKNETLSEISKRYHVSMTDLLKVNNLRSSRLRIGQYLRIPGAQGSETSSTQYALAETKKVTPAPSSSATEKYTLRKGETLSHVSAKYNVSVASLMKWNKINRASSIRAGQKLTVHLPETAVAQVASNSSSGTVELSASGKKLKPGTVASTVKIADAGKDSSGVATLTISGKGKRKAGAAMEKTAVSYYKVRSGDSLWSISKKLQVSTNDIKDWNSLNGNQLQPGTTLVIKNG